MRQQLAKAGQLWRQITDVRRFEEGTRGARAAQERKLREILEANRDTVYGREHRFDDIDSIEAFQARVPINEYDDLEPYVQRMLRGEEKILTHEVPLMFATTSGTTGNAKFVPVTPGFLEEYNHATQVFTWRVMEDYPAIGLGKILVSSSSDVEGYTEGGTPYGAITGFLARRQPEIVRKYFILPYEVSLVKNVEAKYYLTLRLAIEEDLRWAAAANPSTLNLLAEKLQLHAERLIREVREGTLSAEMPLPEAAAQAARRRLRPNPERAHELEQLLERHGGLYPRDVWPNRALLSCWKGGTMSLYLKQLGRFWGDTPIRDLGYMASEGRGSIPLVDSGAAGVLPVSSHFYEFVPVGEIDDERPRCLTVDQLRPNEEYYILLTTSGGFYRYHINDIVRVVDFYRDVPLIQFVRKGQGISSLTGEKLTESQVTASLLTAVEGLALDLKHVSVAPRFENPPYYVLMVEPRRALTADEKRGFIRAMDEALSAANIEYLGKRESQRLSPPALQILAPGSFDRYRQERVSQGAPEAQVKIPHLSPSVEFGKQFEVVEEVHLEPSAA